MEPIKYGRAPVVDIVSFGYKKFFQHLLPMTKLSLPALLFSGLITGFVYGDLARLEGSQAGSDIPMSELGFLFVTLGLFLLGLLLMCYMLYVSLRYARDVYMDEVDENLYNYLLPKDTLLGIIAISLINFVATIPILVVMVIGFFLLIIPGLVVLVGFVYLGLRFSLVWKIYMLSPENGIIDAYRESWNLTEGNVLRCIGLSFIISFISGLIAFPFGIFEGILKAVAQFNPGFTSGLVFALIASALVMLSYWAKFILGPGGSYFVGYRFLFDLKARKENPYDLDYDPSDTLSSNA